MFENKIIEGIHVSRYIASWIKAGGEYCDSVFRKWLESLVINGFHLTNADISYIVNYAQNGKLELEDSAKTFIESGLPIM